MLRKLIKEYILACICYTVRIFCCLLLKTLQSRDCLRWVITKRIKP